MPLSRRAFLSSIGAGGAGVPLAPMVSAQGAEAPLALGRSELAPPDGIVQLDSPAAVKGVVEHVGRVSPNTMFLVDEAYHEYVDDPAYATAIPLALANPNVVVARTFSKVYGMAGLRLGYAIARPETLKRMAPWLLDTNNNQPSLAAATATIADTARIAQQQRLNREARAFTLDYFRRAGYAPADSQANFIMVDPKRALQDRRLE